MKFSYFNHVFYSIFRISLYCIGTYCILQLRTQLILVTNKINEQKKIILYATPFKIYWPLKMVLPVDIFMYNRNKFLNRIVE